MAKKITNHPYANCEIIATENTIACKSYQTIVATIKDNVLRVHGLYSPTTRRHISAFVKEYAGLSYQTAKRLYEDGYGYNITTGEIVGA